MNDLFKIIIGAVIAILIIGGIVMIFSQPQSTIADDSSNDIVDNVQEGVNAINNTVAQATNQGSSSSSNANSNANSGSSVLGGGVSQDSQNGGSEMYQIDYNDGNFRQYDTKTGELIGSSFDEDQEKLGVVNGDLE